jgi:hypothetical protein
METDAAKPQFIAEISSLLAFSISVERQDTVTSYFEGFQLSWPTLFEVFRAVQRSKGSCSSLDFFLDRSVVIFDSLNVTRFCRLHKKHSIATAGNKNC